VKKKLFCQKGESATGSHRGGVSKSKCTKANERLRINKAESQADKKWWEELKGGPARVQADLGWKTPIESEKSLKASHMSPAKLRCWRGEKGTSTANENKSVQVSLVSGVATATRGQ